MLEPALAEARAARSCCAARRGWERAPSSPTPPRRGEPPEMMVLGVTGVEWESDLAFAGLHGLLWPIVDELEGVPEPQREPLAAALGLAPGEGRDRFLVSAGALSLLAAAAESRPILCVVDDAQWLDVSSAHSLTFVARRLVAERVAIVFGAREGERRRCRRSTRDGGEASLHGEWLRRRRRGESTPAANCVARSSVSGDWVRHPGRVRARAELRASGETARRREPESTRDQLTPQELQIAGVGSPPGRPTPEAAAPAASQPSHDRLPPPQGVREARDGLAGPSSPTSSISASRRPRDRVTAWPAWASGGGPARTLAACADVIATGSGDRVDMRMMHR